MDFDFYRKPPFENAAEIDASMDHEPWIPRSKMAPEDFKFRQELIFKDLVELKAAGSMPTGPAKHHIMHKMVVFKADSPTKFWFGLERLFRMKDELDEAMAKFFYKKPSEEGYSIPLGLKFLLPSTYIKLGMATVAVDIYGNCNVHRGYPIVRGYVTKIGETHCELFDVDAGDTINVMNKNMHFVPKFVAECPQMAYRGKLAFTLPMGGNTATWSGAAKNRFKDLVSRTEPLVGAVRYITNHNVVALTIKNSRYWLDRELISQNFAVRSPMYFDDLTDRAPREENPDEDIIEEYYRDVASPRYEEQYGAGLLVI